MDEHEPWWNDKDKTGGLAATIVLIGFTLLLFFLMVGIALRFFFWIIGFEV